MSSHHLLFFGLAADTDVLICQLTQSEQYFTHTQIDRFKSILTQLADSPIELIVLQTTEPFQP